MSKGKLGANRETYLLRREDYKRVKKMDRQQFERFCTNLYMQAYEEGKKSVPGIDITEVKSAIQSVSGIGKIRMEKIMAAIEERFGGVADGEEESEGKLRS